MEVDAIKLNAQQQANPPSFENSRSEMTDLVSLLRRLKAHDSLQNYKYHYTTLPVLAKLAHNMSVSELGSAVVSEINSHLTEAPVSPLTWKRFNKRVGLIFHGFYTQLPFFEDPIKAFTTQLNTASQSPEVGELKMEKWFLTPQTYSDTPTSTMQQLMDTVWDKTQTQYNSYFPVMPLKDTPFYNIVDKQEPNWGALAQRIALAAKKEFEGTGSPFSYFGAYNYSPMGQRYVDLSQKATLITKMDPELVGSFVDNNNPRMPDVTPLMLPNILNVMALKPEYEDIFYSNRPEYFNSAQEQFMFDFSNARRLQKLNDTQKIKMPAQTTRLPHNSDTQAKLLNVGDLDVIFNASAISNTSLNVMEAYYPQRLKDEFSSILFAKRIFINNYLGDERIVFADADSFEGGIERVSSAFLARFQSYNGAAYAHSEAHESAFNAQKGQSTQQPARIIKYPLNLLKSADNQQDLIELFRVRFGDGKQAAVAKNNPHQTYWIFKQKRYKRLGTIKNKVRFYMS
jgi:hypothetical protein